MLRRSVPSHVGIVAVSKTQTVESIREAYDAGQRIFGENKALELADKQARLPQDIEWHFIGHLQTNKVKYLAPFIGLIHSIDSFGLMKEINKEAQKNNRIIDCLLQFHIAKEETKFGLSADQAVEILESETFQELRHVRITGVMGMASFSDDPSLVRSEFRMLHNLFDHLKLNYFKDNASFKTISMGMSGDYQLAIEEGSTMIRIGTSVFGSRTYP